MMLNKFSANKFKYWAGSLFIILFAVVGVRLLSGTHAANPLNPYGTQVGVMDSNGWGPNVASYIKSAGVTWDRITSSNSGLVGSALSAGYNVMVEVPDNQSGAMAAMNTYKGYGSRVVFEFGNEQYLSNSGDAMTAQAYAQAYQATYNAKHATGSGITQPLLFMTTGDECWSIAVDPCANGAELYLEKAMDGTKGGVPNLQVDAFSTHTYGGANQDTSNHANGVNALIYQHQDAVNHGFTNTPWYVSEWGVTINPTQSSGSPQTTNCYYAKSYADQASCISSAYQQMMTLPWLKMIMYYQSHDDSTGWFGLITAPITSGKDYAGEPTGIGSGSGPTPVNPRPAWNTLLSYLPSGTITLTPTASVTSPASGATVSGAVSIAAAASESGGSIASVQFQIDGANVGSADTTSPYTYSWDTTKVSNGSHTIDVKATDAGGTSVTSTTVTVNVNNVVAAAGYHIVGNKIDDPTGKVFEPHGVDVPTFVWTCSGIKSYNSETSGTFNTADFQTMKSNWGTNTIRLSVSQDLWLPGAQQGTSYGCSNTTYQQNIKNVIQAARSAGIVVLLDLHWSDQGNLANASNQQCMPDSNSVTFWKQAATDFMSDSGIWFELYNEPHPGSWSIWQNGGSVCGFTSVGMQQLVDAVRTTGASNIVVAGGDNYASTLSGMPLLNGTNIGYVIHPYANPTNPSGFTTSDWDNRFGNESATQAVIATEFGDPQTTGSTACTTTSSAPYTNGILSYFRQHSIGYTAWAYYDDYSNVNNSPGPCHFPVLLNPDGTCYANDGACIIQTDLQSYSSSGGGTGSPYVQGFTFNPSTKTLSWTAYPGAAGYKIAEIHNPTGTRTTNYSWPIVSATSCVPGGSCNVPAPSSGEMLDFGIIPVDANGNAVVGSNWLTPELSVTWPTTADTQPPSAPSGLSASPVSTTQINLSWTASTDNVGVTGYQIYRGSGTNAPTLVGTATTTSYGDANLSANTSYTYYVVAYDAASNKSAASNSASATTLQNTLTTATVEGVVSSSVNGLPIVNAFINTGSHATPNGAVSTYTNNLGQYSLGGITPNKKHYYYYKASGFKNITIYTAYPAGINIKNVSMSP